MLFAIGRRSSSPRAANNTSTETFAFVLICQCSLAMGHHVFSVILLMARTQTPPAARTSRLGSLFHRCSLPTYTSRSTYSPRISAEIVRGRESRLAREFELACQFLESCVTAYGGRKRGIATSNAPKRTFMAVRTFLLLVICLSTFWSDAHYCVVCAWLGWHRDGQIGRRADGTLNSSRNRR